MTQTIAKHPHRLTAEDLAGMHTRQLLSLLDKSRSVIAGRPETLSEDEIAYNKDQADFGKLVKAELEGREHIPSPAEAKAERQARQARPEKKPMRY